MAFKSPAEIGGTCCAIGRAKTEARLSDLVVLGFLAGAYVAFGGLLAIMVTAGMPDAAWGTFKKLVFGATFPVGLMLVVIGGAELFTGNCLFPVMSCLKRDASLVGLLRNWVVVYLGNLLGSVFVAYCLGVMTGLLTKEPWLGAVAGIGASKAGLTFGAAFFRGIGCNWLVCLAVWMALCSKDIAGKVLAIFFPITAFVALGYEHCVANMYFIPMGLMLKDVLATPPAGVNPESLTWARFVTANLIPVTIGNIVGGAIFVGTAYWWAFLRGQKKKA
jgi:formate/nitrite transporter